MQCKWLYCNEQLLISSYNENYYTKTNFLAKKNSAESSYHIHTFHSKKQKRTDLWCGRYVSKINSLYNGFSKHWDSSFVFLHLVSSNFEIRQHVSLLKAEHQVKLQLKLRTNKCYGLTSYKTTDLTGKNYQGLNSYSGIKTKHYISLRKIK